MEMPEKHTPHLAAVLGANIAGRRQLLGMNQADLAARLDMAPDALSRIENGYTAPRFGRIEQIAAGGTFSRTERWNARQRHLSGRNAERAVCGTTGRTYGDHRQDHTDAGSMTLRPRSLE